MAVTEESEAKVRELREQAIERADRIANGEEPWLEENDEENPPATDSTDANVRNDDVGENDSDAPDVIEVDEVEEPTE